MELINSERATKNLVGLNANSFLENQAQEWSETLLQRGLLEHSTYAPENLAFFSYSGGVENVDLAEQFFNQWKNSAPHYAALTNPQSTRIGIGIACSKTACYAVAQLGTG